MRVRRIFVDDWDARLEAERRNLHVVGTLRVLADGASRDSPISKSLSTAFATRIFESAHGCSNPYWKNTGEANKHECRHVVYFTYGRKHGRQAAIGSRHRYTSRWLRTPVILT